MRYLSVLSEMLGLVAASCILASAFPQLRTLARQGGDGVSITSWALLLACNVVWLSYGISIGSAAVIIGNLASAVAFAGVVAMLVFRRFGSFLAPASVVPAAVALFALTSALPPGVAGALGVALGISLAVPQLLVSHRTWRHRTQSTVASGSWLLILTGQLLWLGYGVIQGELAIIVVNVVAAAISSCVLGLEVGIHRAQRVELDPPVDFRPQLSSFALDEGPLEQVSQGLDTGRRSD